MKRYHSSNMMSGGVPLLPGASGFEVPLEVRAMLGRELLVEPANLTRFDELLLDPTRDAGPCSSVGPLDSKVMHR